MSKVDCDFTNIYKDIGRRLKEVRGTRSQTAFGEPLGYRYGYVKDCEHGKKPSLEYLYKVSGYYAVSLDWLIHGIDPMGSIIKEETQRYEVFPDAEMRHMWDVLVKLMNSSDPHVRSWAIVQFRKAFADHWGEHAAE